MNILILSTVHPWNDPRIFHKGACTLAREHRVTLAAAGEGGEREVRGVRVIPLGIWKTRLDRRHLWGRALREAFTGGYDAIHFHDPELALLLAPCALLGNKKLVFDVHEHPQGGYAKRRWIPRPLRKPVAYVLPKLLTRSPSLYDHVILAEDGYLPFFPRRSNVHVIHNWALIPDPDVPWFDRYEDFDPRRELRLIYFGQLLVQRGAWKMVEIVKRLAPQYPGLRLDLVGAALPPALGIELQRAAAHLEGRLVLHGYRDFSDTIELLRRAHLGLIPLLPDPNHEGSMATKFFDYMTYGLPFVASNLPHWMPFLRENPAGIAADPSDPASFSDAIVELVESPDHLRDLSRSGYRIVRGKFRWEAEKLLSIYRGETK